MKKIVAMIRDNPIKWVILGVVYIFICRAFYLDTKNILPWYCLALACILGLVLALFLIAYTIEPFFKYTDAKTSAWFGIKRK